MRRQQRATAVRELVRRLGSRRQLHVDSARARLSQLGSRAVGPLIESLESDDNRVRAHAMPLLALIQDPRAIEPIVAMLLDRDPKMREIAARSLGRIPSPDAVIALERQLAFERRPEVRVSAVHALLQQYDAGHEEALRRPIAIMSDESEDPRVRVAALALLRLLRPGARRSILARLEKDPCAEVSKRAAELDHPSEPAKSRRGSVLRSSIEALGATDYAVWHQAVQRLAGEGSAAVDPLVKEMRRRAHDPEFCNRVGIVLKSLGARRCRALGDALDRVDEPLPLQVLVEVVGTLGEKSLVYRLNDVIERVARRASRAEAGFDPIQHVRARAHLELAKVGSRVAAGDLRAWLHDPEQRLEMEMLAAVERIGKRDEIPFLLRAALREDRATKERIAEVVRAIMKRERVRKSDPMLQSLGEKERRLLDVIAGASSATPRRTRRTSRRRRNPLTQRAKKTIRDVDLAGRRVFCRVDWNVPLADGRVADDTRIRASLPTLRHLIAQKASVVLASHLGRPAGKPRPELSLRPLADHVARLIESPVAFSGASVGAPAEEAARKLTPGQLLLLENLRFHKGEEDNDSAFAASLARLADAYVNDAFGTAHRAHASTVGVPAVLKPAVAGFLMESELRHLGQALHQPERPFVSILGGAKVSDKIELIENLLPRVHAFLIGGAMAYTFLKAFMSPVGKSLVEDDRLTLAKALVQKIAATNRGFVLPVDHVVRVGSSDASYRTTDGPDIVGEEAGMDIGPKTSACFAEEIARAKTVLWNGPLGRFEVEAFAHGTRRVAEALASFGGVSIVGGGETTAAVEKFGLASRMTHVSTGGGAALEFLSGMPLPGVDVLDDAR